MLRVETDRESLCFKESYGLPPGEGACLAQAHRIQGHRVGLPEVVAAEGSRVLMRPLAGVPLLDVDESCWARAVQDIAQFQ
ncbi:MAG: hypothetical protein GY913_19070 [Proteobacteria bacterium]|nr:hypothetical protein [Pseudomonadota bacterium]MCP4919011.1 hypothetical protein [Pseudomonadota bacterium]